VFIELGLLYTGEHRQQCEELYFETTEWGLMLVLYGCVLIFAFGSGPEGGSEEMKSNIGCFAFVLKAGAPGETFAK